jgi:hypothetical protein
MGYTIYKPYDGDYIDADYTKLINDVQIEQGYDIGDFLEICVTLTKDDRILIRCSNDEGSEWDYSYTRSIPAGWDIGKIREMFSGNVYLKSDTYSPPEPEDED